MLEIEIETDVGASFIGSIFANSLHGYVVRYASIADSYTQSVAFECIFLKTPAVWQKGGVWASHVTEDNELQPAKAAAPINVTYLGIVIVDNEVQRWNPLLVEYKCYTL